MILTAHRARSFQALQTSSLVNLHGFICETLVQFCRRIQINTYYALVQLSGHSST